MLGIARAIAGEVTCVAPLSLAGLDDTNRVLLRAMLHAAGGTRHNPFWSRRPPRRIVSEDTKSERIARGASCSTNPFRLLPFNLVVSLIKSRHLYLTTDPFGLPPSAEDWTACELATLGDAEAAPAERTSFGICLSPLPPADGASLRPPGSPHG